MRTDLPVDRHWHGRDVHDLPCADGRCDAAITELISSAIGMVAFALLFGVPKTYYLSCGLIGGAGRLMYRLMMWTGMGATFAVFFATVVIVLLSRFAAVRGKCPATVFLSTGIFPYFLLTNADAIRSELIDPDTFS